FVLLYLTGDPSQALLPPEATEATRAAFRHAYGLDEPLPLQYLHYLSRLVQGDFGRSFAYNQPALQVVLQRLPATIELSSTALALWLAALLARLTRSGMLDVLSQDYVRTARAKGLAEWAVTTRHALRNTLVPIITVLGLQIGGLLGGAVMTETVFAWPGVGTLVLESILK